METAAIYQFLKIHNSWAPTPDLALNTVGNGNPLWNVAVNVNPCPSCPVSWQQLLQISIPTRVVGKHPKHPGLGCFGWVRMSSNPKIIGTIDLHFQLPLKRYITCHILKNFRPNPRGTPIPRGWGKFF